MYDCFLLFWLYWNQLTLKAPEHCSFINKK